MTTLSDHPSVQDALHAAELAEHDALALLDRALRLARRLTCTELVNLRQPWPRLANRERLLNRLLAPRRHRTSTRKVKSPISRYSERRDDGRPDRSRTITDLTVTVREPGPEQQPLLTASRDDRHTAPTQRRRHRILALLQADPNRLWRPAEIAAHFGDVTLHTMYRQLSRWAENGLIHKLGPGLYAATAWTSTPLPPAEAR